MTTEEIIGLLNFIFDNEFIPTYTTKNGSRVWYSAYLSKALTGEKLIKMYLKYKRLKQN